MSTSVDDLLATFNDRADRLGVETWRVADRPEALRVARDVAGTTEDVVIAVTSEVVRAVPDVLGTLGSHGLRPYIARGPGEVRDVGLGLTLAHRAAAESGSVVLAERDLADRSVGMLAKVLIVLVPTGGLMPGLDETAAILRAVASQPRGGYATIMTGPSRTADIERVLTVGVQGPGRVIVVFVDDLPVSDAARIEG